MEQGSQTIKDPSDRSTRRENAEPLRIRGHSLARTCSPKSPAVAAPPPCFQRRASLDLDDYFTGPRDTSKHSKWPIFLQMHGSIMPKLILPLIFVTAWAAAVTVFSKQVHYVGVDSVLLTITGFVVGLGLSFRNSTAYERYAEGRKYWASLVQASQVLGRLFWIHASHLEGQDNRQLMLQKLSSMNLIVAFAVSLKHSLRFEPFTTYPDLHHLIGHLDTFAKAATDINHASAVPVKKRGLFRELGQYLGVSFAESNPRKLVKKASQPLGNLPLEILNHIAVSIDLLVDDGHLQVPMHQTLAYNNLAALNEVMVGSERVLSTPMPIAYTIAISQITWIYVVLLPFQLLPLLSWIAIPASIAASYIILGLLFIGREIENPFGQDVNDLPLESYCDQIAHDLDLIAAYDKPNAQAFLASDSNMPLYPVSTAPVGVWMKRSEARLRTAIKEKPLQTFEWRRWGRGRDGGGSSRTTTSTNGDHNV